MESTVDLSKIERVVIREGLGAFAKIRHSDKRIEVCTAFPNLSVETKFFVVYQLEFLSDEKSRNKKLADTMAVYKVIQLFPDLDKRKFWGEINSIFYDESNPQKHTQEDKERLLSIQEKLNL